MAGERSVGRRRSRCRRDVYEVAGSRGGALPRTRAAGGKDAFGQSALRDKGREGALRGLLLQGDFELAPEEQPDGREESGLVVSTQILDASGDQTGPLATVGANSSARSSASLLQALTQLSETMIMLVSEGEMEHARAVHEAIGRLLTPCSEPPELRSSQRCEALK